MADGADWRTLRIVDRVAGHDTVPKMSVTVRAGAAVNDPHPAMAFFAPHADPYRSENELTS